jgi:hypothetical protein
VRNPLVVIGNNDTYPNILAICNAAVVKPNWNNAIANTDGNWYVDNTILLAKITHMEEMA